MKTMCLFFSLLGLFFKNLEGQIPDLPLSFTNEEVAEFRDKIKPYILPPAPENTYDFDIPIVAVGTPFSINLLRDAEVFDVDSGSLYVYKFYSYKVGAMEIFYEDFFISESSNFRVYSPEYMNETHVYYSSSSNPNPIRKKGYLLNIDKYKDAPFYYPKLEKVIFHNLLILEFFQANKDCLTSSIIIDGLVY
ncbi:MAG: hypothetical protein AB8H03_00440 [Saprospiraceae bacterium]